MRTLAEMRRPGGLVLALVLTVGAQIHGRQSDPSIGAKVDQVFARWTDQTPGCAVGVSVKGRSVLKKAYGMADLEHDVKNTPETIFEAGSVSKQFTAAAVLLLARDGKLLVLKRRPDNVIRLAPAYADGFRAPIGFVRFARDASGRVTRFHISQDRVWKLPFVRRGSRSARR